MMISLKHNIQFTIKCWSVTESKDSVDTMNENNISKVVHK